MFGPKFGTQWPFKKTQTITHNLPNALQRPPSAAFTLSNGSALLLSDSSHKEWRVPLGHPFLTSLN